MGSQTLPRNTTPVGLVAHKTAAELNDILNALGLRLALLRHRSQSSPPSGGNIERLGELIDKAVVCVRNLQDYLCALQLMEAIRTALIGQEIEDSGTTESQLEGVHRMRVLLIGRNPSDDGPIKSVLERGGCDVIVASSDDGLEALQYQAKFDNIICASDLLAANESNFDAVASPNDAQQTANLAPQ